MGGDMFIGGRMAQLSARETDGGTAEALLRRIVAEGTAAHPHVSRLTVGTASARDLADAVHFLCVLHGRHPGVLDHALDGCTCPTTRPWLEGAAAGFTLERGFITRLAVAAGAAPSTPGSAGSEGAVTGQAHALQMLARSERTGCAPGAAIGLVLDWAATRAILERAAERLGLVVVESRLPDTASVRDLLRATAENPAVARAMSFGAEQLLAQHRGLYDLLEARQSARQALDAG